MFRTGHFLHSRIVEPEWVGVIAKMFNGLGVRVDALIFIKYLIVRYVGTE